MKRPVIPYNPHLKPLAKKLRQHMTFSEVKLWNELKNGKMLGYDFDRQRPISNYIVDFYCTDLQLAIEVDGITHAGEEAVRRDSLRQKDLEAVGIAFLRFDAMLVVDDVEAATKAIATWIKEYESTHGVPEAVKRRRDSK
jgi:very-short-patch-repair endonuclease